MRSTSYVSAAVVRAALCRAVMAVIVLARRLVEQRGFEPLAKRCNRYAIDDFGAERVGEQVARGGIGEASAAQVEERVVVEPADGCAVRAFDVVGEDLELRLGVDLRFGAEKQVTAR